MAIFDGAGRLHGLGSLERELLESAALLHDVGASVNRSKHHRHSRYLILHAALPGFDREEVKWIATIARFHTGRNPKVSHDDLGGFGLPARRRILRLAAMLRSADALHHSHRGRVVSLRVLDSSDGTTLDIATRDEEPGIELWAAEQKAALWRECFGSALRFRTRLRETRRTPRGVQLRRVAGRR